jgi:hypothetical protein
MVKPKNILVLTKVWHTKWCWRESWSLQRLTAVSNVLEVGERESLDLDQYVTDKALDGLFFMLAQEEANIRSDPAARVTDLLKKVFR